jgi:hypothetical protein
MARAYVLATIFFSAALLFLAAGAESGAAWNMPYFGGYGGYSGYGFGGYAGGFGGYGGGYGFGGANACLQSAPVSCPGGTITQDSGLVSSDNCRHITCQTPTGALQVSACEKPDEINPQYFEMYKTGQSGSGVQICIDGACLTTDSMQGYSRSPSACGASGYGTAYGNSAFGPTYPAFGNVFGNYAPSYASYGGYPYASGYAPYSGGYAPYYGGYAPYSYAPGAYSYTNYNQAYFGQSYSPLGIPVV